MKGGVFSYLRWAITPKLGAKEIPECFTTIETQSETGSPVIGIFNAIYKQHIYDRRFCWCATMRISLNQGDVDANGLPYDQEARMAHQMERLFVINFHSKLPTYYVGHVFKDGYFEIFWYLRNSKKARDFLEIESKRMFERRKISYQLRLDPKWNIVQPFLKLCADA